MIISTAITEQGLSITILRLEGNLDGSSYQEVVSKAHELYNNGMRNLVLDMSGIPFMSSSGILALHTIALLLRDGRPHEAKNGWTALGSIDNENSGLHQHVKLVNPPDKVYQTLQITGMNNYFEIYKNLALAVASFK